MIKYFRSLFLVFTFINCSKTFLLKQNQEDKLYKIDTGIANVFLIQSNEKSLLIDTSAYTKRSLLEEELIKLSIIPNYIILTHGHGDHAGNAKYFQSKYKSKILAGKGDLDKFITGSNGEFENTSIISKILKPFVVYDFDVLNPDILIDKEFDLREIGFNGKVIPIPGHTPGSLLVFMNDSSAFVGDLIRGGIIFNKSNAEHFFHEDRKKAREQVLKLLELNPKIIYPAHFGPLDPKEVKENLYK